VDKIIAGQHIGLIDGLPGTGKSSTLWWALQQPKHSGNETAWLHLDRYGEVTKFCKKPSGGGNSTAQPLVKLTEIEAIKVDILVIDGVNQMNYGMVIGSLRQWCLDAADASTKSSFLTMSNKIKREHLHELKMMEADQKAGEGIAQYYCTQHS
jgi:hypothetical protein